jgi:DNA repair photolyase
MDSTQLGTPKRVWNPPNPYLTEHRELLGEAPAVQVEVYEDQSKSILSRNDSPDIGFRWSVNPYRGCFHACAYCLHGDTPILMADGTTRPIQNLKVGDKIYGTVVRGDYRRYTKTSVLAVWSTIQPAYRLTLSDGRQIISSEDHRFLTRRGWKYVTGAQHGWEQRPHLTHNDRLLGVAAPSLSPEQNHDYRTGYLCGMIRGDALLKTFYYTRAGRTHGNQHQFRLALVDAEPLERTQRYLREAAIATDQFIFSEAMTARRRMLGIRTHASAHVARIQQLVAWPATPSPDWGKGFLAGIFDAEGSYSQGILRISNTNQEIIQQTVRCLSELGFDSIIERGRTERKASQVRVRGGLTEHVRFFQTVGSCIVRKKDLAGKALKNCPELKVVHIESTGLYMQLFDITTGTGDFIANGVVSHNCYARPTHEYFGFGAGTDFERKIFIKRQAPQLLEQAFRRRSWHGELITFSGVTDCYQPLEAVWKLTRGCLEVCATYRNPVGIITKSLLIRRDIDVLKVLVREAEASVSISIPFLDEEIARAIEPGAPTIHKRFETMTLLADAGIAVGIGVAPVIPGLNDSDIPGLLKQAKRCGARYAFKTLLRLPGSVKDVFFHRMKEQLPLKAAKIEHRIRETRDGALYDSRFGHRHHGTGEYWNMIERQWDVWVKRLGFNQEEGKE